MTNTPLLAPYRTKEAYNGGGVGAITLLGPPAGYQSFANGGSGIGTFYTYYTIEDTAGNWETGLASVSGTTLTRLQVLFSSAANALVNFAIAGVVYAIEAPAPVQVGGASSGGVGASGMIPFNGRSMDTEGNTYTAFYNFAYSVPTSTYTPTYLRVSVPQTLSFGSYYDFRSGGAPPSTTMNSVAFGSTASAGGAYSFMFNAIGPTNIGYGYSFSLGAVARISGSATRGSQEANTPASYAQSHDVVLSYVQTSITSVVSTLKQPQIPAADTTTIAGIPIATNTTYVLSGTIIGKNSTDYAVYRVFAVVDRIGGVPVLQAPTPVTLESGSAGSSSWSAAIALDTVNNLVLVQATSPAAHWVADLRITEATP